MAKLKRLENDGLLLFFCPGCEFDHPFRVKARDCGDPPRPLPVWTFNGDMDRPTFSPSLIVFKDDPDRVCHLFVRDGNIEFLPDCHHALAGRTVPIPDYDY